MDKEYFCIPEKSQNPVLRAGHARPALHQIQTRAAPKGQPANLQTGAKFRVKGAKALGNQISIKEVASVNTKPPRNWDAEADHDRAEVRLGLPSVTVLE